MKSYVADEILYTCSQEGSRAEREQVAGHMAREKRQKTGEERGKGKKTGEERRESLPSRKVLSFLFLNTE